MKIQDAWRESAGQTWVKLQERTDAQLEPLGRPALERLKLVPGESVLDVGAGTGQTTVELARRVEASGSVVALDISEPMVSAARKRVAEAGLSNTQVVLADAATHDFEHPFDALYSRFGVMFFSDPTAAFSKLRANLKPSARLGFVCWQPLEVNDWARVSLDAALSVVPALPIPDYIQPGQPGPFYFSDPDFVHQVLKNSGFGQIEIEKQTHSSCFGASKNLEEAVDYALQIGPASRLITAADPDLLPAFRRALSAAFTPYVKADGVWMDARTLIVSAKVHG
jgi:SAM-dependent methyltransferase